MASDTTKTSICNIALSWVSGKRVSNVDTGTGTEEAICLVHYDPTRRALLRAFDWPFAKTRVILKADQSTPLFGHDYEYALPDNYMRLVEDENEDDSIIESQRLRVANGKLYSNDSTVNLEYIRDEEDQTKFDDLFIELLAVSMAVKMVFNLAGTGPGTIQLRRDLQEEQRRIYNLAKNAARRETDQSGRSNWNWAKFNARTTRSNI